MSTPVETRTKPEPGPHEDPWYYGWRYVKQTSPDGQITTIQVPLSKEDVLHPQEDDFIVQNGAHEEDCYYLRTILSSYLANRPGVHVLHDHRIDWGVEEVGAHGPDFAVIDGFPANRDQTRGTFYLAEFDARALLVLEVTSPTTRDQDLDDKVDEYYQAGVPFYVIVDRHSATVGLPRLLAYRAEERGYVRLRPDAEGWLELEPIGLWLAFEEGRLAARDGEGRRLADYREAMREMQESGQRAREALEQLQAAEERIRQLEAELNHLRGQPE